MKKFQFQYEMQIDFSSVAQKHSFTLKCFPHSDERQEITDLQIELLPKVAYEHGVDSFGNAYIFGHHEGLHSKFRVIVKGIALLGKQDCVHGEESLLALYRQQDEFTMPGRCIEEAFCTFYEKKETDLETAIHLMHQVYNSFQYLPGSTEIRTTAEQAMKLRKGVCQDYSNVLLSMCRKAGLPSRYVVGMLEGEGASHAWVEVYCDGAWYGLDPTNDMVVTDGHVTISHGRNYKDCRINRGIFCGGGNQMQTVYVNLSTVVEQ